MILVRVLFVVLVLASIVKVCAAGFSKSSGLGFVISAAVVARALVGFGLLALTHVSAVQQAGLVSADGFWALAPDARVDHTLAARVAAHGPFSIGTGAPSPFFIEALGAWLWAAGATPASVVLFNVACYAAIAALVLWVMSRSGDRAWTERAGVLVEGASDSRRSCS